MRTFFLTVLSFIIFHLTSISVAAQVFVELNCENLFDTRHDEGKQDEEFTPEGSRRWTPTRYWRKLNATGQEILSCSEELPALVAIIEIENDTVARDLTRRSLLRNAGYEYLMTESPDVRGLDVALLYLPARFRLHLFIVHAPSRYNGELETRPHRRQVTNILTAALDTLITKNVIVAGDFNDYADSPSLAALEATGLVNISAKATGASGRAKGTYRYHGEWQSLDHILLSPTLTERMDTVYINDATFLLEPENTYGGWKPRRTYNGYRYQRGFSDHLPLVLRLH